MSFTSHWNRRYIPTWEERLIDWANRPVAYLEVGVYEAYTICRLMDSILSHPESTAVGIDPWESRAITGQGPNDEDRPPEEIEARARANVRRFGDRVRLIKGRSEDVLPVLVAYGARFDFIFIDGLHTPEAMVADSKLCWQMLREGGVLIWDDCRTPEMSWACRCLRRRYTKPHDVLWTSTTNRRTPMQIAIRKRGVS